MEFSRQEYWSGLHTLLQGTFLTQWWSPCSCISCIGRQVLYHYCYLESLTCTAAAAAKLLQSCPTLCDPIDDNPPGCPAPGILQARTLEWVASTWQIVVNGRMNDLSLLTSSPEVSAVHLKKDHQKELLMTHNLDIVARENTSFTKVLSEPQSLKLGCSTVSILRAWAEWF